INDNQRIIQSFDYDEIYLKKEPVSGELALAIRLRGIRPARKASRPASTAFFMAEAMSTGFCAAAIAVFISTPSQPSSIAIAASLSVPTPASTSTGTLAFSLIIERVCVLRILKPERSRLPEVII